MAAEQRPPAAWRRPYSAGPLTPAEFEAYWTDGYVVKRGLLRAADDLAPCLAAIERCAVVVLGLGGGGT
jgi:hypothetical protein